MRKGGRVSRIGRYAIASSITDPTCFSCTTFNILAPIYKRLDQEVLAYVPFIYILIFIHRSDRFPISMCIIIILLMNMRCVYSNNWCACLQRYIYYKYMGD